MPAIENVKLKFNCPKTRDSLEKRNNTYQCGDCKKEVVDFTNQSKETLSRRIGASKTPICGIFNQNQVNQNFLKYAAATALVCSSYLSEAQVDSNVLKSEVEDDSIELTGIVLVGEVEEHTETSTFIYPKPIGSITKFYEVLKGQLKYPKGLDYTGRCYVKININTDGNMTDLKIVKGLSKIADEEAMRAIRATNFAFKPALENGIPVDGYFIVPIIFRDDLD